MTFEHKIVFTLLGIPIHDTVVMTWIMIVALLLTVLILRKWLPHLLEMLMEFIYSMVGNVLDEDDLTPYIPLLGSLFLFVLFANLMSIIPRFSAPVADVNTTLALALIVFFSVHYYGIRKKGLFGYLKSFSDPVALFPLELLGQFSRTLSLTLRLFGNMLSGELIVAIVFSLIPLIVPIPMIAIGLASGVIQAFILTTLATVYISSAIEISKTDEEARAAEEILKAKA